MMSRDAPIEIGAPAPADPLDGRSPDAARERLVTQEYAERSSSGARHSGADASAFAELVLAVVEELRQQAEEVGRLRERLEAAEQRAGDAEEAARTSESARAADAALADDFADLLERRLREAQRRLREFDRWLAERPPRH